MARKPVTLELVNGKGKRQRMWEAIRRLSATVGAFSQDDIWQATEGREKLEMSAVRDYRRGLVGAGILACAKPAGKSGEHARYTLAMDEGAEAPRVTITGKRVTQGLAQEQMWRALRMLRADTNARELAAHASTQAVPVAESAAGSYLRMLHKAGYMVCVADAKPMFGRGKTQARYRLLPARNTGPKPPMVCREKVVFDPNRNAIVWPDPITEEECIYGN